MRLRAFTLLSALTLTLIAGITASRSIAQERSRSAPPPDLEALAAATALSSAFEHVADTIGPSVVTIRTRREIELSGAASPFRDFFGDRFDGFQVPQRQIQQGEGSGVIVTGDGFILTNNHVVADADEVEVLLTDGRSYPAEVIGTDARTDIAVVRIHLPDLRPAQLGNSDTLRVGQWVVAAGNPFGLASSITAGIVSATGRSGMGITDYEDFIQTDAAINRGNSGGPLVNLHGEVIGINTAILSRTGGNVGIGFAIPINMARDIMEDLIDDGRVVRGYLGVLIQNLDENMARSFGYDQTDGALVGDVTDDGPAGEAGVLAGDIITHLNGDRVTDVRELRLDIASTEPGTEIELTIFRDGATYRIEVEIGELPESIASAASPRPATDKLGMTVQPLTPALAQRLGVDELSGVVISAIDPAGIAARSGLRRGDVITHVQGAMVESERQFLREIEANDLDKGIRLTVSSRLGSRFVILQKRD